MDNPGAETRRRAYLKALEIDVYSLRGQSSPSALEGVGNDVSGVSSEVHTVEHEVATDWSSLQEQVAACTQCTLHKTRAQTVFGVGNQDADWMIIGEAPGAEEDRRGEPFVGRAGQLLDEMLRALGLRRDAVFIANILKCRPPNNRDPSASEAQQCRGYLHRQIELVAPSVIIAVGRIAAQLLLDTDAPLGRLRQQKHYLPDRQIPVVVTYHPAYLLRSPSQKRKSWQDLCFARQLMTEQNLDR